jgi:hypothetical protein
MITLGLMYSRVVKDMLSIEAWINEANLKPGVVMKIIDDMATQVKIDNVYIVYGFDDETAALQFRLAFDARIVELDEEEALYMQRSLVNYQQ